MIGSNSSFFKQINYFVIQIREVLYGPSSSSLCSSSFISGRRFWVKPWRKWMPIDEIDIAVSCSATVTDEFELQLTKTGNKARNWMSVFQTECFKMYQPKTKLKLAFLHSRVSGTKLKTYFENWTKMWLKWVGKPILKQYRRILLIRKNYPFESNGLTLFINFIFPPIGLKDQLEEILSLSESLLWKPQRT